MHQAAQADWQSSRLRLRLQRVLWVPIEAAKLGPLAQRRLGQARLWIPTAEEMAIVRADWDDLMGALGMGADVSAREGQALQIRPKAADAKARVLGSVEGGAGLTRPMGFYLRPSFTAHILGLRR